MNETFEQKKLSITIPEDHQGWRLDRSLATLYSEYSRARIQLWINEESITVDGIVRPCKYLLTGGEQIEIFPSQNVSNEHNVAEDIALNIIYEDESILVINKPAGLVVHPGAGNSSGTLLNALLFHNEVFASLPRAGIVHRLDKDTSGLMVVAKSLTAHTSLVEQLQRHEVQRKYFAVVRGQLISGRSVDQPIGRHKHDRVKMAISERGKPAVTHFTLVEKFQKHTWIEARLETGRTHQIRVHLSTIGYPLVGDQVYAPRIQKVANVPVELNDSLCQFPRQALHAHRLALVHPETKQQMQWDAPMPRDMADLLEILRKYSSL
jgi:23S rRNA pseudouridine1911/1915/1917 synthase